MSDTHIYNDILGKTIKHIDNLGEELIFHFTDGEKYVMKHFQDCCEIVYIEDICGEFIDLYDSPLIRAEQRTENLLDTDYGDGMFTFYEFATNKASVTIRWNGSSNGYYSISVSFYKEEN